MRGASGLAHVHQTAATLELLAIEGNQDILALLSELQVDRVGSAHTRHGGDLGGASSASFIEVDQIQPYS